MGWTPFLNAQTLSVDCDLDFDEVTDWTPFLNAQTLSADCDLDFDPATWFLYVTHHLVMMIVTAKYFSSPTMHDEVTGLTRL